MRFAIMLFTLLMFAPAFAAEQAAEEHHVPGILSGFDDEKSDGAR